MTSENWFDWDSSDTPATGAAAAESEAKSPDGGASPGSESTPEQAVSLPGAAESPQEPSTQSASIFQTQSPLGSPGTPSVFSPFDGAAPLATDSLPDPAIDPALAAAHGLTEGSASENGTSTALRALHLQSSSPSAPADAVRPFHLWVTGSLKSYEKERLLELLQRENFGIRGVDLEVQLEAGRILFPRVSEFAAVLVAQTLRGASVELRLEPSEHASVSPDEAPPGPRYGSIPRQARAPQHHPAENLPVTSEPAMSGQENAEALDVVVATGLIREPEWRAETSDAFAELVESLKRELRFKAHLKRADALVRFEARVLGSPWISESECRVQASALAIRFRTPG